MTKQEFYKIMQKLGIAYKKTFEKEEYQVWYDEFKKTDLEEFEAAINKTIKEVIFIPKVADVRARIAVNPIDYYINDKYRNLYKNLEWGKFVS